MAQFCPSQNNASAHAPKLGHSRAVWRFWRSFGPQVERASCFPLGWPSILDCVLPVRLHSSPESWPVESKRARAGQTESNLDFDSRLCLGASQRDKTVTD